jgi:hypothetical protein
MAKARITVSHTFEFDMNPENYDNCKSDLERLQLDINGFSQPGQAIEAIMTGSSLVNTSVTGELIREAAQA